MKKRIMQTVIHCLHNLQSVYLYKKREHYFTNESTKIHVFMVHVALRSRLRGGLSLPPFSMPFLRFSVPAENFSNSEKVRGFPSFGKLQQIVCERREVLRTRRL